MEDFEQIKVIAVTDQEFTDPKSGEVRKWHRCEGRTHSDETFCFSRPITEEVKVGSVYGMFLDKDRYFKPKVGFRKLG